MRARKKQILISDLQDHRLRIENDYPSANSMSEKQPIGILIVEIFFHP